jgi:hypothetical protein
LAANFVNSANTSAFSGNRFSLFFENTNFSLATTSKHPPFEGINSALTPNDDSISAAKLEA